jgi:hypothetical protein
MQVLFTSSGRVAAGRADVDWVVCDRLISIALSRSITHFGSANDVEEKTVRRANIGMILFMIVSVMCGSE